MCFISEGLFLNHRKNIITQIKPINPFKKKDTRQPNATATGMTMRGAIAAPAFCPTNRADILLAVSLVGNHRDITEELVGYDPDSPIPNRKRTTIKEISPVVIPVNAVNKDHHNTIRIKTAFCPIRSPKMPEGISNMAYASANAPNTQPNCSLVRLN